ncbi:hypothetical protein D8674_013799 [Pyrus ussuriensis x Pyrus communis]|uniref:Uncharacterized protein n=1 Tax=Pyrus ussuriensis x Pyrus communis TaxID=2448454 RepID=A0A5N5GXV1_9ROSA|nr:hypothetical protein D8674_013799 [Pyrus ussuriensis x Pyrus communis]
MIQKKEYLANLSKQQRDVPLEELTTNQEVSLQLLMDEVGRWKGKEVRDQRECRVREVRGSSSLAGSNLLTETNSKLQWAGRELAGYKEVGERVQEEATCLAHATTKDQESVRLYFVVVV